MVTKTWKVFVSERTDPRDNLRLTSVWDYLRDDDSIEKTVEEINSDAIGTNDYIIIKITARSEEECRSELEHQLSEGIFKTIETGAVEEAEWKWFTACRENGELIEGFDTYHEAEEAIAGYYDDDKADGCYEAGYYDIETEDHMTIDAVHKVDKPPKVVLNMKFPTLVREAKKYKDKGSYVSDMVLSDIWEDDNGSIPQNRIDYCASIWDAAHRDFRAIASACGVPRRQLAMRFSIPLRTVEDWARGKSSPAPYTLIMMQEALGLICPLEQKIELTLVDDSEFAVRHSGLKFLFLGNHPVGSGVAEELLSIDPYGNRISDMYDSLLERDCAIYKDQNGNLYGVETFFYGDKFIPGVWQRIGEPGKMF